ncbi:MAG: TRAP transporter substrate-binding protein DctP [Polyangiales bacterium]
MVRRVAVVAFLGFCALPRVAAADPVKLKVGTAAAPDSPWGQVFKTWRKAVEAKTSNAVSFDFYFNSTQGTEMTMVDKMKAGQLDGGAFTSTGLSKFDKRLLVMQLPGVIRSWQTLDAVRDAMEPDFTKYLAAQGVTVASWGDIGPAHFLSKGFAVRTPDDLKGKNPWVYAGDPVLASVYSKVGGVNAFPAELMSVLPNIDTGKINCLSVPALAAEMLQWNSKFDNGVDQVNGIAVGAVVLTNDSLSKLPGDGKAAVLDTAKAMSSSAAGLKQKLRTEDAAAWARFKARSGVTVISPTDAEKEKWRPIFKAAIDSLKAGTFDPALVDKVVNVAKANGGA